jgi:hypothetical protein
MLQIQRKSSSTAMQIQRQTVHLLSKYWTLRDDMQALHIYRPTQS